MKIAKQISTGKYINDFQDKATAEVLISNAVRTGIDEKDIEIIEVEKEQYDAIIADYFKDYVSPEKISLDTKKVEFDAIKDTLKTENNMTDEDLKLFASYLNS